jgi:mRNA interferase MazF
VQPSQREVWDANLSPAQGHEQGGTRPVLIVSVDQFNHGPGGLAITVPITRTERGIPLHVPLDPPEGGLDAPSMILCEQLRCVSIERLHRRRGQVRPETLRAVLMRHRLLLK